MSLFNIYDFALDLYIDYLVIRMDNSNNPYAGVSNEGLLNNQHNYGPPQNQGFNPSNQGYVPPQDYNQGYAPSNS